MIRALVAKLAARLAQPRVIFDGEGTEPYLSRYYLTGRPVMADGSEPFDPFGNPRGG